MVIDRVTASSMCELSTSTDSVIWRSYCSLSLGRGGAVEYWTWVSWEMKLTRRRYWWTQNVEFVIASFLADFRRNHLVVQLRTKVFPLSHPVWKNGGMSAQADCLQTYHGTPPFRLRLENHLQG